MPDIIRVLIVDDSAYVRKVVAQMLSRSPFIEVVGTARDGADALERVEELRPDVVTCDLNMPVMDGLTFVRTQMARRPIAIVLISIAAEQGAQVLAALDAGAFDFVQKPTALATEKLMDIADELVEKVKVAARASMRPPAPAVEAPDVPRRPADAREVRQGGHRRDGHLDRRAAGAQDRDPALPRRLPGSDRDRHAHAGRLYRDVRAKPERRVRPHRGGGAGRPADCPGHGLSGARGAPPDVRPRRGLGPGPSGRASPRHACTAPPSMSCFSPPPKCSTAVSSAS